MEHTLRTYREKLTHKTTMELPQGKRFNLLA